MDVKGYRFQPFWSLVEKYIGTQQNSLRKANILGHFLDDLTVSSNINKIPFSKTVFLHLARNVGL
jgi:hypothetical protein